MFVELDKQGHIIGTAEWKFSDAAVQTEREIVRGYDGRLYFKGEEPAKPEPTAEEKVAELETCYQMTRWQREGILAEPEKYSALTVERAQEIENMAMQLRKGAK